MCIFCSIIKKESPAEFIFEDDVIIVIKNILNWAPVMLMVIPKKHMLQEDMYTSEIINKITKNGIYWGKKTCPNGFRLLSNFGSDGLQSVEQYPRIWFWCYL